MAEHNASQAQAAFADYDVVHARILRFFPELVAELGGDLEALAVRTGLSPAIFARGNQSVTYRDLVRVMEAAASGLACSDFGLRLAARQNGAGMFGPLGHVMRNSRTFGDALRYVSEHAYAHSLAARVWLRRLPEEGMVFSGHDILLDGAPHRVQAIEQILLAGHLAAMELTGGRARVRRVHFRHQPVSSPRIYRRYFGCEVRFGEPADGVLFSQSDLACPIAAPDAQAFAEITAYIDKRFTHRRPPFHADVRGVILRMLGTAECSNEQVASALCVHVRTLHRRLREEGTSFQKVKDEVRRDLMLYYLEQTDFDLARISEKLGFAEQSVMSRNCRQWFAMPPRMLRRKIGRDKVRTCPGRSDLAEMA